LVQPVQEEIRRRFKEQALNEIARYLPKVVHTLGGLLQEEDPGIRLKACQLLLDYAIGKPKVSAEFSMDSQAANMLAAALVMPDGKPAHPVIPEVLEGEIKDE
jgi:hypothetical protein